MMRNLRHGTAVWITFVLLLALAGPASADTHTVTSTTAGSIQAAIDGATSGDTIVLSPGTYYQNGMFITGKSLTFRAADGHGPEDTIIDGNSAPPRIFTVTDGSTITIENLALRNGMGGDAADCSDPFISLGNDCGDGGHGGAIYSGGNVALTGSTITDSRAGNGAAGTNPVFGIGNNGGNGGSGGAIYAAGAVTLTGSTLASCSAGNAGDGGEGDPLIDPGDGQGGRGGSGGAIYAAGPVTLVSSKIIWSHAGNGGQGANQRVGFYSVGGSGGAIYGAGMVTLTGSTITGCWAGNGGAGANDNWGYDGGNGGAISAGGAVTLSAHSSIARSSAGHGGAGGPGSCAGCMGSWGGNGGHGGGVIAGGPVTISSSAIENCLAGDGGAGGAGGWVSGTPSAGSDGGNGGGIYSTDTVTLSAATITGCAAGAGGAGGEGHNVRDGGNGGTGGSGGAIFSTTLVTLGSSGVTVCSAGAGGAGGSGGWLASNGAHGPSGNGGAIFTYSSADLTGSAFSMCFARTGGAIHAVGEVAATSSSFTTCAAETSGGAIYTENGPVPVSGSVFTDSVANFGSGGAIYTYSGDVPVTGSAFTSCAANSGNGGAVHTFYGSVPVTGSMFDRCTASGNGGAVYTMYGVSATSSTFTSCTAAAGSAIYGRGGPVHFCRLVGNSGTVIYSPGRTFDAAMNWWGSNNNPSAQVNSVVSSSPWLVLGAAATPASITTAQTSSLRADLTHDSGGGYHDPASGHVPDGIPVSFAVASGPGSVSPASGTMTAGSSQAVFTPVSTGTASVTATVDGQTVSAFIGIASAPVPAVTGISPASGTTPGGTDVTITGTGFSGATAVLFGAAPATAFTVLSDTEITATSPAGAAGTVDIVVTTPAGSSLAVPADRFTYIETIPVLPAVTGISPASGPTPGGTDVTITGTGFTGAIAITFGTAQATSYTVTGDTLITATSPPGAAGSVDITVTTPGGTSPVVTADWFTYMDNTPVPEFPAPAFPVMVLSALALLTILFRKAGQESP